MASLSYPGNRLTCKTVAALPEDLASQRPYYVDQLGMYCYLAGREQGVVVVYRREEFGREPGLRAYRVHLADLESVGQRMREARDLFLDALARGDPSKLGQCEWYSRRCDYRHVCPCEHAPLCPRVVDPGATSIEEDDELAAELLRAASQGRHRPAMATTLNDLVFPRRGVLLRTVGRQDDDDDLLPDLQRGGFFSALLEALRYGDPGAYRGTAVELDTLRAVVHTHHDVPVVIRTTGTLDMIERDRIPRERPYWLDRLALEAALLGQDHGRLVVYYPRIGTGDRFMVYDIGFKDTAPVVEEALGRLALFAGGAGPEEFPACGPDWLSRYCPFKKECACQ